MQSEVKMTPEPLSTTPRLSTQNGTAEAFVFLQALAASGRRHARVSSLLCTVASGCPDNARVNGLNSLFANTHAPDEAGSRAAGL